MIQNPDNMDLLFIEDIITAEEKSQIIKNVDRDFSDSFKKNNFSINEETRKIGLFVPLVISLSSIILSSLFLAFFIKSLSHEISYESQLNQIEFSESEWKILKLYKEKSDRALVIKNNEILMYQEKIAAYDQRLTALKELIMIKREIEININSEIKNLSDQGISEDNIAIKINQLEKSRVSSLSSDMKEYYYLSVDELNKKIDDLLQEKNESELEMNKSIGERSTLLIENEQLYSDILNSEKNEIVKNNLEEIFSTSANLPERKDVLLNSQILQNLSRKNYDEVLLEIKALQDRDDDLTEGDLEILSRIKSLTDIMIDSIEPEKEVDDNLRPFLSSLEEKNLILQGDYTEDLKTEAENSLRELLNSYTELSSAFFLLNERENTIPQDLVLLGRISSIRFNQIQIIPESGISVEIDTPFFVYKRENENKVIKLGSGIITESKSEVFSGRITMLTNTKIKPDLDDSIYLLGKD